MKTPSEITEFATAARECAMQMMENASYIRGEAPNVLMPESLRETVEALCETWLGTIVAHLDEKCGKLDLLKTKAERAIELLKERRSALIAAAVTGKIDVREA
jgi:hypothetical protein